MVPVDRVPAAAQVSMEGVEPSRSYEHQPLKLACLPFHHIDVAPIVREVVTPPLLPERPGGSGPIGKSQISGMARLPVGSAFHPRVGSGIRTRTPVRAPPSEDGMASVSSHRRDLVQVLIRSRERAGVVTIHSEGIYSSVRASRRRAGPSVASS
jgi:hypothetical protein